MIPKLIFAAAVLSGFAASAIDLGELRLSADRVAAARDSQALVASGHVHATAHPIKILSDFAVKDVDGTTTFSDPTEVTTCTNELGHLHWRVTGEVVYKDGDYALVRNAWFRFFEVPVLWIPYWRQSFREDFGLQLMPGWTKRWGAFLLTKYNYHIAGDQQYLDNTWWLHGNTRFDLRYENGIAIGESLYWNLGDFGAGRLKVYYAWDMDADRYSDNWCNGNDWNYRNWGSEVSQNRYDIEFEHRWEATERDTVRMKAQLVSDSSFLTDFRDTGYGLGNRTRSYTEGNEAAWEHRENVWGGGVSVSGPLNDFYSGVSRLPEVYFDVAPTPILDWPVNYESQSRLGHLARDYAQIGNGFTDLAYRCNPGIWADYEANRFDTYHRLSAPFKVADVLSVVPRLGYRGTFWSESGLTQTSGGETAGEDGSAFRSIGEFGVTFAARGTAWIDDEWQHMLEPYMDFLGQEAWSDFGNDARPYVFDSLDASCDWSDQLAGRSRNLPYTYYGVTPGLRNALRTPDERGVLRTILDLDVYAACQLNDADIVGLSQDERHRMSSSDSPNRDAGVTPGVRTTWRPAEDTMLGARMEFDLENGKIALVNGTWAQRLSKKLSYHVSYIGRDHRVWDFAPSYYDSKTMSSDEFNWLQFGYAEVGLVHDVCDCFAWSPYVRWDCREGELDEIGSWFDYRLDCICFRLILGYENEYTRLDGSSYEEDFSIGLMVYLRAFGPSSGLLFGDD